MEKELREMTLEELCELFPVFLVPHSEKWGDFYSEMEAFLKNALCDCPVVRISHIGSTALPGIMAKNIVDILVEVDGDGIRETARAVERAGFTLMSGQAGRFSFNLGYTKAGFAEKVYHLHLRCAGDNDELYFRDFLQDNPEAAKEYESLKIRLRRQYPHDRDGYTRAKGEFVKKCTEMAKKLYGERYK